MKSLVITAILVVALVILGIVLGAINFTRKSDCEARGGELARPMFSYVFHCYGNRI